jgi:hypothetical protein
LLNQILALDLVDGRLEIDYALRRRF